MTTDHNEAMRLAEWLRQNSSGVYRPAAESADPLTRQAAELKSARAETNRIIALLDAANDERKALRVEVAELRAALWHVKHVAKDIDAAKTIAGNAIDTARKATP